MSQRMNESAIFLPKKDNSNRVNPLNLTLFLSRYRQKIDVLFCEMEAKKKKL